MVKFINYNGINTQRMFFTNRKSGYFPSFGSINVDKEDAANLRNIPYQCCACCGKPMIEEDVYKSLTKKDFDGKATHVLKKLQAHSRYMRKTEKTVFNLLKRTAAKYPDEDLSGLLQIRYPYHLSRLEAKQVKIIDKAVSLNLKISDKTRNNLDKTLKNVNKILFVEPNDKLFKRNRVIEEFKKLKVTSKEKKEIDKIINVVYDLPTSTSDADAYIVKYAFRDNAEIGKHLLSGSRRTLDHIIARIKGGRDVFPNLLVMCDDCNKGRGYISYNDLFGRKPKMPKNIIKNLRKVTREIKEGRLENFDTYPQDVMLTLDGELTTKNKINLNI